MATTIERPSVTEQEIIPISRLLTRAYALNWEAIVSLPSFCWRCLPVSTCWVSG
jgi:hypothetical protein